MSRLKTQVLPGESAAIHAKLDEILCGGDTAEILLVLWLLLDLSPFSRHKHRKKKGQPKTAALKIQTRTRRASQATSSYEKKHNPVNLIARKRNGECGTRTHEAASSLRA
ncbi:MAG TPA: hypothetical protein VLW46_00450 [Candidatus Bathyarchaeia archaeon]|nr:hypothetical protein [Candidatus Bathyarchaeia archaeon]